MNESRYRSKNFRKIRSRKGDVQATVETLWMKLKLETGDNVYLRGLEVLL
jgi:hypothetical protein